MAEWQRSGGAFDAFLERGAGAAPPRWGALKVTTTNMLPGWLRRNGVPYSQNATITEYFTRDHASAGGRLVRGDDGRRRPDLSGAAVRHELELQERGERFEMESGAVQSELSSVRATVMLWTDAVRPLFGPAGI